MAILLRRNKLFYNLLRHMHRSTDGSSVPTFNMNTERKAFLEVLPEVINSVVTSPKLTELPEVGSWMKKLLEYTLGGGKLGRGLMVSIGYRMFEEPANFSGETQHSARVLGWCSEMVKFLIMDDIADGATIRRGKPCWHLQPNVGLTGIKDGLLLYQSMLDVLDMYFGRTPNYGDLLKYFNESAYRATVGEHLDFWSTYSKEKNNLDVFNMKLINTIAINKSAYYTFKLPIFLPLLLVKNGKKKATEELSNICMQFGRLMQCQDDYMDVYVNDSVTGKTGRDIQEGKCTWVAVTALQHCNNAQRSIFKEYYGSKDPAHVKLIKQLYDELHLPQLYEQCERTMYDDLLCRIHALPTEGARNFVSEVLNAIYKREITQQQSIAGMWRPKQQLWFRRKRARRQLERMEATTSTVVSYKLVGVPGPAACAATDAKPSNKLPTAVQCASMPSIDNCDMNVSKIVVSQPNRKLVQNKRSRSKSYTFASQRGRASTRTVPDSKVRAADIKVSLIIPNVNTEASDDDIISYIKSKTR